MTSAVEISGDMVKIGEILREHGVRGEVKVHVYNPDTLLLQKGKVVQVRKEGEEGFSALPILSARAVHQGWLIQFKGLTTMDEAACWRKAGLYVPKKELPQLEDGEYYLHELMGYALQDLTSKVLGSLKRVEQGGGSGILVVTNPEGQEILLPMVSSWIKKVDREKRVIVMDIPEGLI